MIFQRLSLIGLLVLILFSCNSESSVESDNYDIEHSFPEFYIEKGSDVDSSYISFKGIRKNNDTLEIQATSWGVIEYGLFLYKKNYDNEIQFQMMGRCGTVSTITWKKVTLIERMSIEESSLLQKISFTNSRDTIVIVKTHIF